VALRAADPWPNLVNEAGPALRNARANAAWRWSRKYLNEAIEGVVSRLEKGQQGCYQTDEKRVVDVHEVVPRASLAQ